MIDRTGLIFMQLFLQLLLLLVHTHFSRDVLILLSGCNRLLHHTQVHFALSCGVGVLALVGLALTLARNALPGKLAQQVLLLSLQRLLQYE